MVGIFREDQLHILGDEAVHDLYWILEKQIVIRGLQIYNIKIYYKYHVTMGILSVLPENVLTLRPENVLSLVPENVLSLVPENYLLLGLQIKITWK